MKELDGKTAIIRGGAEGIGRGMAQVLGRYGMNIVIADINAEQLEKARQSLEQAGTPVLAVSLDVVAVEQWRKVAEQAMDRFGKVHMLVNNAGVGGALSHFSDGAFESRNICFNQDGIVDRRANGDSVNQGAW